MSLVPRTAIALSSAATTVGACYSTYLTAIGIAAHGELRDQRAKGWSDRSPSTRFRILIPAHNEELLIKDTVAAARELRYPAHLYEIHVVADNCTDRTAEIADEAGAHVHRRRAPDNPGKGPALTWLLAALPTGEPHDAFIILDADTVVEPDMLRAFDASFADGAEVVQGHYAVRGEGAGGEVDLRSAAFAVRHLVRPAGRVRLGGSSSLYGNGMAFSERIARAFPWSSHLTEDLDMGLRLLLAGETVDFAPRAVVRGEMPNTLDAATSQHERWESGRRSVTKTYLPRLLAAANGKRHGKRWAYIDASLDIAMPPFGTLAAVTGAGAAGFALAGTGRTRSIGAAIGLGSIGLQTLHILASLRLAGAPFSVYRSLLRAPLNIVWKIGVLGRTLRHGPTDWVRTSRNDDHDGNHATAQLKTLNDQTTHDQHHHDNARRFVS